MVREWPVPKLLWQASQVVWGQAALLDEVGGGMGEGLFFLLRGPLGPVRWVAVAGCPEMGWREQASAAGERRSAGP